MSEQMTEVQRENLLSSIAAYQMIRAYQTTGDIQAYNSAQEIIDDMPHGDYELALGLVNLSTILIGMVMELAEVDAQRVLQVVAETVIEDG